MHTFLLLLLPWPAQPLPRWGDVDLQSLLVRGITCLSYSRASAGEKRSITVNQSCLIFVLQPLCLHLHWVFPPHFHIWHICGARSLLQLEPGGQTATAGASRGAPAGPQCSSALSLPGWRSREHLAFGSLTQGFNCFLHLRGGSRGKGSGRNLVTAAEARGVIRVMVGGVYWQTSVNLFAANPPGTAALLQKSLCPSYRWCAEQGMEKGHGDPPWEKAEH